MNQDDNGFSPQGFGVGPNPYGATPPPNPPRRGMSPGAIVVIVCAVFFGFMVVCGVAGFLAFRVKTDQQKQAMDDAVAARKQAVVGIDNSDSNDAVEDAARQVARLERRLAADSGDPVAIAEDAKELAVAQQHQALVRQKAQTKGPTIPKPCKCDPNDPLCDCGLGQ